MQNNLVIDDNDNGDDDNNVRSPPNSRRRKSVGFVRVDVREYERRHGGGGGVPRLGIGEEEKNIIIISIMFNLIYFIWFLLY